MKMEGEMIGSNWWMQLVNSMCWTKSYAHCMHINSKMGPSLDMIASALSIWMLDSMNTYLIPIDPSLGYHWEKKCIYHRKKFHIDGVLFMQIVCTTFFTVQNDNNFSFWLFSCTCVCSLASQYKYNFEIFMGISLITWLNYFKTCYYSILWVLSP